MKILTLILAIVFITACQKPEKDIVIEGTPIKGDVKAYTEMCQKEPESILCKDKK